MTALLALVGPGQGELVLRLGLATALGAAVGLERQLSEKAAGLRTHALVALGAAAFTVGGFAAIQLPEAASFRPDVARIGAQVVTGIGFLGAGLIVFSGGRVRGLTTAADLWVVAAIGLLCALGLLITATAATALALTVIAGLRPLERWLSRRGESRAAPDEDTAASAASDDGPATPPQ